MHAHALGATMMDSMQLSGRHGVVKARTSNPIMGVECTGPAPLHDHQGALAGELVPPIRPASPAVFDGLKPTAPFGFTAGQSAGQAYRLGKAVRT